MDLDLAGFVEAAIREKLAKMQRSREWRKRKRGGVSAPPRSDEGSKENSSVEVDERERPPAGLVDAISAGGWNSP